MSKKKTIQNQDEVLDSKATTEQGGWVQGVYMSREMAAYVAKMVYNSLEKMKLNQFLGKMNNPQVKNYIEVLEDKIASAEKVANYKPKKK